MPNELEKACLGCTLPICDDQSAECAFIQIQPRPDCPYCSHLKGPVDIRNCPCLKNPNWTVGYVKSLPDTFVRRQDRTR